MDESLTVQTPTEDVEMEEAAGDEDDSQAGADEDRSQAASAPDDNDEEEDEENKSVATSVPGEDAEEEENKSVAASVPEEDAEDEENKSVATSVPVGDASTVSTPVPTEVPKKKRGKPQIPASARKGRAPAVKGLHIPFRTVKKVSIKFYPIFILFLLL
jgi:hypothetical protein